MGGSLTFWGVVGAAIGAVAVAFVGRQAQSEFQDWTPRVTDRLIERALLRLPEDKRERYREEWSAHVSDTPGEIGKWLVALGYLRAARIMRASAAERGPLSARMARALFLVIVLPLPALRKLLGDRWSPQLLIRGVENIWAVANDIGRSRAFSEFVRIIIRSLTHY